MITSWADKVKRLLRNERCRIISINNFSVLVGETRRHQDADSKTATRKRVTIFRRGNKVEI